MPRITEYEEHPTPTRTNGRRYQFTPKHHGCDRNAACWEPELTREQEFEVFQNADFAAACDEKGNHYGVLRADGLGLVEIGTVGQKVAKFPVARDNEAWHGYPLWPIDDDDDERLGNRRKQQYQPTTSVLICLEKAGLITRRERKQLRRGDLV